MMEATRAPSGSREGGKGGGKSLKYFGKVPEISGKVINGKVLPLHVPGSFEGGEK